MEGENTPSQTNPNNHPMILSISYHNEETAKRSYEQLALTTKDNPMPVYVLDNNYPLIKDPNYIYNLCDRLGFFYVNAGENLGSIGGFKFLMDLTEDYAAELDDAGKNVITLDGDMFPLTNGWNTALFEVLDADSKVVMASIHNNHSFREMDERGFTPSVIGGHQVRIVAAPVVNSVSAVKRGWFNKIMGDLDLRKYYGGAEIATWRRMDHDKEQWVFLCDYTEDCANTPADKIYTEFKWKYAHLGMDMSFEQYVTRVDLHGVEGAIE